MKMTDKQLKSFTAELRDIIDSADDLIRGLDDMMGETHNIRRRADTLRDKLAEIARQR